MTIPPIRPAGGRWRYRGPGVLKGDRLGAASPHLASADPEATVARAREAAARIRSGTVAIEAWDGVRWEPPSVGTAAGQDGTVIYVARGKARFRFGPHREFLSEAEAGDAVFVPAGTPYGLHNAAPDRPLDCLLIGPDGSVAPLAAEAPGADPDEEVLWVDPVRARG